MTITGYLAPSANYTLTADPTVTADITAKALTIPDAAVTAKTYDNTTAATITGTLTGVISGDTVTFTGTGTFASAGAGSGISVTSSSTLGGASSGNYSLTQPTGLTGDINKASQTITFGALPNRNYGEVFALSATVNSGLTVSYASSDTSVVTVSGNLVTAVGVGTTTITASVAGNDNYNAASTSQSLTVVQGPFVSWTFESTLSPVLGSGTATLIGGTTSTYATGVAGNGVPTSGTAVSATGIVIGLDFRQSATSSKYWQLQLSSDGTTFVNASGGTAAIASGQNAANTETAFSNDGLYVNNPGSGSQQFVTGITYTLTGSAASAYVNNSNFAWRWVSVFSPGGSSYAAASSTYGTAGTARFDNVYVQYLKQSAQTIAFGSLDAKTYGDSTFALSATANSGLSVSYSSSDTSVATVAGSTVTILKAGSTVITASQAGNAQYAAATSVQQTLTVGAKALTIGAPTLTTTKEYDGTTTAAVTAGALSGVVGSDTVTASAT
ncbi:MAG: hypothetical protein EBS69_09780, partial [Verrucomicrobia bacterium]|nr:hypothetical protein [Verrucomicrobiota bacterium]